MPRVLIRLVKDEVGVFVHKLLHRVLDKLVEGVELLAHETFLREERRDDSPAIVLVEFDIVFVVRELVFVVASVVVRLVHGGGGVKVHRCSGEQLLRVVCMRSRGIAARTSRHFG